VAKDHAAAAACEGEGKSGEDPGAVDATRGRLNMQLAQFRKLHVMLDDAPQI